MTEDVKKLIMWFVKGADSQFLSHPFPDFSQISRLFLYIITVKLSYSKICAQQVPKMLTNNHKSQQICTTLDFPQCYYEKEWQDWDKRWDMDAISKCPAKDQTTQFIHNDSPSRPVKFKQTGFQQKPYGYCVLGPKRYLFNTNGIFQWTWDDRHFTII